MLSNGVSSIFNAELESWKEKMKIKMKISVTDLVLSLLCMKGNPDIYRKYFPSFARVQDQVIKNWVHFSSFF